MSQGDDSKPIRVMCAKSDGKTIVLFKEYADDQLGQARTDAAALRGFGITAYVVISRRVRPAEHMRRMRTGKARRGRLRHRNAAMM